ncbi:MAG: hypothetical protein ACJA1G_000018 [Qipengyuania sp.]|jgi:hypothetical protein
MAINTCADRIDAHRRAGHECGMFGAQEADPAGDLAGLAQSPDGDLGDDLLEHRFGDGGDHVGVDIARRDRVDGDPEARAFLRQRLGEAVNPAFGGGVVDLAILSGLAIDRPDVDDAAPSAFFHPREGGLGGVETAAQIGAHDRVPVRVAHLEQRAVAGDPGIVDHHVDRAMLLGDACAGRCDSLGVADIELARGDAGFFSETLGGFVIAGVIGDHGKTALVAQAFADCAADPACAPGYNSHP